MQRDAQAVKHAADTAAGSARQMAADLGAEAKDVADENVVRGLLRDGDPAWLWHLPASYGSFLGAAWGPYIVLGCSSGRQCVLLHNHTKPMINAAAFPTAPTTRTHGCRFSCFSTLARPLHYAI
ncbi:MAG: hypothetical protein HC871_09930 [Rhizobiales bacterium]|nr:hypothetical protein [Hyphomicrobiales bacterium]